MTSDNAAREIAYLSRVAADTTRPPVERVKALLIVHQRTESLDCLCGWGRIGQQHAGHQAEVLADFGLLAVRNKPEEL